jgi:radical SAM protein (TIGR01212 family)
VFCDNAAFSPAMSDPLSPADQVRALIGKCGHKYKLFLPYLQPFSNTYAPVDRLKVVYESILSIDGVVGLAIGTRPDCFDGSVYGYLGELGRRSYISVELGLQSGHDEILERMNRRHTVKDFRDAVCRLDNLGIETVAHIILGFPGETDDMVWETAAMLADMPVRGVKVHQLMVIRSTPLEGMYLRGEVPEMGIERYAELLYGFLSRLRPDQYIHRISANSSVEQGLIAPMWSAEKLESTLYLKNFLLD